MPVSQRGSTWTATVNRDGKRHRQGGFKTKKDATAWEQRINRMLDRGILPDAQAMRAGLPTTLGQLREITLKTVWRRTKGEHTAALNSQECIDVLGEDYAVADVGPQTVTQLTLVLQEKGLDNGTVNRKLAAFSRMLTLAVEVGALERRPTIRRLKESAGRDRFLTVEEQEQLLTELGKQHAHVKALALFLVETGMRVGEALKLRWSDVAQGKVVLSDTKSGKSRTVPVTVKASMALKQVDEIEGGPFALLSQSQVTSAWNKAKAELEWARADAQVVPHCLRHTCASRLVMAGVNLIAVMRWLGHSSIQQTMRYAHLAPDGLEDARDSLESFRAP